MYTSGMRTSKVVKPNNKNEWDVKQEMQSRQAGLRSYGGTQSGAEILWDISEKAKQDQIFILRVGKEEVLLDAEELRRYLRWI